MISGIIATVLLIIVCLRSVEKRLVKKRGILSKVHTPVSVALAIVMILHIIFTFPLLASRSIWVLSTGLILFIFIMTACFSAIKKKVKLHRVSAVCAALFIVLHIAFNVTGLIDYRNQVQQIAITDVDLSKIPDGVYYGECDVTFIYSSVMVTVKSNAITDIVVLEHRNERGGAAELITGEILKRQKIDVDAVSGATISSTVIKKAVENALQNSLK